MPVWIRFSRQVRVKSVNVIIGRGDERNISRAARLYGNSRFNQRLSIGIAIHITLEELAKTLRVYILRGEFRFLQVGARPPVVVTICKNVNARFLAVLIRSRKEGNTKEINEAHAREQDKPLHARSRVKPPHVSVQGSGNEPDEGRKHHREMALTLRRVNCAPYILFYSFDAAKPVKVTATRASTASLFK